MLQRVTFQETRGVGSGGAGEAEVAEGKTLMPDAQSTVNSQESPMPNVQWLMTLQVLEQKAHQQQIENFWIFNLLHPLGVG